jgi:hypothetical protein
MQKLLKGKYKEKFADDNSQHHQYDKNLEPLKAQPDLLEVW